MEPIGVDCTIGYPHSLLVEKGEGWSRVLGYISYII